MGSRVLFGGNMDQYFAENAAAIRATFSFSFEFERASFESFRNFVVAFSEAAIAGLLLLIASPVMLLCVIGIKLSSRGPSLYKQERIGRNGKAFTIYKFRSMRVDAEEKTGPVLSWTADPRVTPFGNFLRKTHLDELPQLWNVMVGDMGLVGPRPERPFFVSRFRNEVPYYHLRERVKPGITGLAQVCCGYNAGPEEKLEFDLLYIQHQHSWSMYFLILYYTARKILLARTV